MEYNFSNVLLILHVKYFYIGYDLKLLLTKVVGGHYGEECGEGLCPLHIFFSILDLKMASFGALWVPNPTPVGDASPSPSGSATVRRKKSSSSASARPIV